MAYRIVSVERVAGKTINMKQQIGKLKTVIKSVRNIGFKEYKNLVISALDKLSRTNK